MKKLRGTWVFTMVLLWLATVAAVAPDRLPERLYDIRGPILPPGLPPFAASATLLLATAIGLIFFRLRRNQPQNQASAAEIPVVALADELSDLKNAYLRGEFSESVLFDRLMPFIRNLIPGAEQNAATNDELIKLAKARCSAERLQRTTALLELCDRVRFGRVNPGKELTLQVLDDLRNDMEHPSEDSR